MDEWVTLSPAHPLRVVYDAATGEPSPYIEVRGGLEARINRAVYYELAGLARESDKEKGLFGVWSGKTFYPVGRSA